ncbi:UNVERIFIED_CONTAM: hypothetical protein Scaly_1052800 [Sesamum calycinum]|uniref:Transposase MuDR plant domain-containing protein n=1 Tax=Sesamum calycinum TaxID=2727403 RepID=A0AAW2QKB4_9LAMI
MSLRHQVLVDFPDPKYEKYGKEPFVTIILYHGSSIIRSPKPEYVGGIKKCPNTQSGSSNPNVEPQMDYVHCPNTQPDSLNPDVEPQMQTNIQKGKGVAVDDGNDHDLDEIEWDEVCKIVDSYVEGNGSGDVDDDDGVSDESDGLFDSELEGDDGEGDDSETDSNVDDCGGEDSGQKEVESSDSEDTTSDDDVCLSQDDFDSVAGSDGEGKEPHPVFNSRNKYDPHFEIGMIFSNKIELREAIHSHAVSTKRSLKIFKNDKRRVYVKCLGDGCQWIMHALKLGEENAFRTDPKRNVKGFRKDIIKELRCHVSRNQAYRAKKKALEVIEGKAEDQFDSLWDYASELRNSNPGSTVMMVMTDGDDGTEQRKFSKFYVCFDALRQGFLSGCRPVIGVDGCHLKGPYGGVLLSAVSIDPKNNLYPLAYVVVSGETREAWQWFLELLKDDLHVVRDDVYTFISDKQKGLIPAFEYVSLGQIIDSVCGTYMET